MAALGVGLGATPAPAQDSGITPPEVLTHVDAVLPDADGGGPQSEEILLELTVGLDGRAHDIQVLQSAGQAYDTAAVQAVEQWTFRPTLQNGVPIEARTRIPFRLQAPPTPPQEADGGTPSPESDAGPETADAPLLGLDGGALVPNPDTSDAGPPPGFSTTILGRAQPRSRGASDFQVAVGELRAVPRASATEFLKLAPGILLTNEGGEGHPEQIFLRGFDAREGQDLELTAGGVPINQSGNLHGNGYADLHFIIPELVDNLRVLEGPFDPRQGNYAVAGSADYSLGLDERGITAKGAVGAFGTQRAVLLWGPPGSSKATYGGVELFKSDGYGQNRDNRHATAMLGYETQVGDSTLVRLSGTAYSASYHTAGVLRDDDVDQGRIGFYDTYDFGQGGDSSRYSLAADVEAHAGAFTYHHQVFFVLNGLRLRENFTGFLLDPQESAQQLHPQRGDLVDLDVTSSTWGARGWARTHATAFGNSQEFEVGYFARLDAVDSTQYRIEHATGHPYHLDASLASKLGDIGLYGDANLRPLSWLTLRGGARADLFTYDVLDRCAVQSVAHPSPSDPPGDESCLSQQDFGRYREPVQRATTASSAVMPRATVLVGPFHDLTLTASYGQGVRSIDPQYITQDVKTPFASIAAVEAGVAYASTVKGMDLSARVVGFSTHVDRDLIFSETAGRNVLGSATTRRGVVGAVRLTGSFFDTASNLTLVRSTFDDTGLLLAYVPDAVFRSDSSVFHTLPFTVDGSDVLGTLGLGLTFVGRRPLPFGERSDTIFTVDMSATLGWRALSLELSATNLLDRRYRLGEYNYASYFPINGEPQNPTLVPVRHFTAGPPRELLLTLGVHFGGP